MTNVTPANEKPRKRMIAIASEVTEVPETEAAVALGDSEFELPTVVVALGGQVRPHRGPTALGRT